MSKTTPPALLDLNLIRRQSETLRQLAAWLDEGLMKRGDLNFVRQHSNQFKITSEDELRTAWKQNESAINKVIKVAEECRDNPQTGCSVPEMPDFPAYNPTRVDQAPNTPAPAKPACAKKWVKEEGGRAFAEEFTIQVGPSPIPSSLPTPDQVGELWLTDRSGRIYDVQWRCDSGYPANYPANPCNTSTNPAGGQSANWTSLTDGRGFRWKRHYAYHTSSFAETYLVSYELFREVCE